MPWIRSILLNRLGRIHKVWCYRISLSADWELAAGLTTTGLGEPKKQIRFTDKNRSEIDLVGGWRGATERLKLKMEMWLNMSDWLKLVMCGERDWMIRHKTRPEVDEFELELGPKSRGSIGGETWPVVWTWVRGDLLICDKTCESPAKYITRLICGVGNATTVAEVRPSPAHRWLVEGCRLFASPPENDHLLPARALRLDSMWSLFNTAIHPPASALAQYHCRSSTPNYSVFLNYRYWLFPKFERNWNCYRIG